MSLLNHLPEDWPEAALLGRIWREDGPSVILAWKGRLLDVTGQAATSAQFCAGWNGAPEGGEDLGPVTDFDFKPSWGAEAARTRLLSPLDLHCIKAAGVTFAVSALERVIEERARGDAGEAQAIRAALGERMGGDLRAVKPGSEAAARLKAALIEDGLWSQYLEVAIGPDAEIFTKGPVLSSIGWGEDIGVRSDSAWNNSEPEIVLVCDGTGRVVGATLGNDMNLRDFEGRSALLLAKAKDNNASCAVGPFIRLFDSAFGIDDVRAAVVSLEVDGDDGFALKGVSTMSQISRDPLDLAGQAIGRHHQYPDGFALFLGTLFAPIEDRDEPGGGFTHRTGDRVRISSPKLGTLLNRVAPCDAAPPWTFGIGALMANLAGRGLLSDAKPAQPAPVQGRLFEAVR